MKIRQHIVLQRSDVEIFWDFGQMVSGTLNWAVRRANHKIL